MTRVFFSAGEASGDAYAARLARGLVDAALDIVIEGIGGKKMQAMGARMVGDSSKWGAVSIVESARVAPRVIAGYYAGKAELKRGEPGLFVPIDYGFVNIKLARFAKRKGWRVVYFIPPGSWRRDRQGQEVPLVSDRIITPFDWSAKILNQMGGKAEWFGHPLLQMCREANLHVEGERYGIAVLPGSRHHEIENNLPVIAQAARQLGQPVHFGLASSVNADEVLRRWAELSGPKARIEHGAMPALLAAKAAIVCSGTATLEAAICDCPMVVVYRGSKVMELEYRIRKPKFTSFSLPNILLDAKPIPELLQWDATAENICRLLEPLLRESDERAAQLAAFARLKPILGSDDAVDQAVRLLADELVALKTPFLNR